MVRRGQAGTMGTSVFPCLFVILLAGGSPAGCAEDSGSASHGKSALLGLAWGPRLTEGVLCTLRILYPGGRAVGAARAGWDVCVCVGGSLRAALRVPSAQPRPVLSRRRGRCRETRPVERHRGRGGLHQRGGGGGRWVLPGVLAAAPLCQVGAGSCPGGRVGIDVV